MSHDDSAMYQRCMDQKVESVSPIIKQIQELSERIEKLEKMNKSCIDANPIKDIYHKFEILMKRLSELEEWTRKEEDRVCERLTEVEGLASATTDAYNRLCAPSLKQMPHKCPVCALGILNEFMAQVTISSGEKLICLSCEGKGIVFC
jgi:hypothetical protein